MQEHSLFLNGKNAEDMPLQYQLQIFCHLLIRVLEKNEMVCKEHLRIAVKSVTLSPSVLSHVAVRATAAALWNTSEPFKHFQLSDSDLCDRCTAAEKHSAAKLLTFPLRTHVRHWRYSHQDSPAGYRQQSGVGVGDTIPVTWGNLFSSLKREEVIQMEIWALPKGNIQHTTLSCLVVPR